MYTIFASIVPNTENLSYLYLWLLSSRMLEPNILFTENDAKKLGDKQDFQRITARHLPKLICLN